MAYNVAVLASRIHCCLADIFSAMSDNPCHNYRERHRLARPMPYLIRQTTSILTNNTDSQCTYTNRERSLGVSRILKAYSSTQIWVATKSLLNMRKLDLALPSLWVNKVSIYLPTLSHFLLRAISQGAFRDPNLTFTMQCIPINQEVFP